MYIHYMYMYITISSDRYNFCQHNLQTSISKSNVFWYLLFHCVIDLPAFQWMSSVLEVELISRSKGVAHTCQTGRAGLNHR